MRHGSCSQRDSVSPPAVVSSSSIDGTERRTRRPASTNVFENQTAGFAVEVAGGYDAFTFQWREDGENIPGADNRTYIIAPAVLADSGKEYSVMVSNTVNGMTAISAPATLRVLPVESP